MLIDTLGMENCTYFARPFDMVCVKDEISIEMYISCIAGGVFVYIYHLWDHM